MYKLFKYCEEDEFSYLGEDKFEQRTKNYPLYYLKLNLDNWKDYCQLFITRGKELTKEVNDTYQSIGMKGLESALFYLNDTERWLEQIYELNMRLKNLTDEYDQIPSWLIKGIERDARGLMNQLDKATDESLGIPDKTESINDLLVEVREYTNGVYRFVSEELEKFDWDF